MQKVPESDQNHLCHYSLFIIFYRLLWKSIKRLGLLPNYYYHIYLFQCIVIIIHFFLICYFNPLVCLIILVKYILTEIINLTQTLITFLFLFFYFHSIFNWVSKSRSPLAHVKYLSFYQQCIAI